jgi:FkbM family methyltransferase
VAEHSPAWRGRFGLLRSLWLYARPGRQRALRRMYRPFVDAGDTVFDVGAHVGDRTRAFAGLGARVVALEPHPDLADRLRRRFGPNAGVEVVETALGAEPGRATLHVSSATPTVSTLDAGWIQRVRERNPGFADVRWDRPVDVPVTTLDALIERYGEPAFVKIDVEGHEAAVLAGLARPLRALSVEFVAGALDGADACIRRLDELGTYAFNAVAGERRRFLWPEWRPSAETREWLAAGADGLASGDLYARRVDRRAGDRGPV